MMRVLLVGKRHFCPRCGRSRLVSVTEHGGEIGANLEEDIQCGEGAFEARMEYVRMAAKVLRRAS